MTTIDKVNVSDQQSGGRPQVYGYIMGPALNGASGTAELYAPLKDDLSTVDQRRKEIALPSLEDDLEKVRPGARIGPFMTPLVGYPNWDIPEVYR